MFVCGYVQNCNCTCRKKYEPPFYEAFVFVILISLSLSFTLTTLFLLFGFQESHQTLRISSPFSSYTAQISEICVLHSNESSPTSAVIGVMTFLKWFKKYKQLP